MPWYIRVLFLAVFFASSAMAQPVNLCLDRPIKFAHYEFGLMYSTGYGGIDDDLQKELQRRSGCPFSVDVRPRAKTWVDLRGGGVDMAGSGIQTPERDHFAWFFHYVVEDNIIVLGPKVPANMRSFDQFMKDPKLTLGGVRSYRYSPYYDTYVDQLIAAGRHNDISDPEGLYRMFAVGRFDAFITNPILYLYYVKTKNLPEPARIERWDTGGPSPSGLVLSKKSFTEAQAQGWRALMDKMMADGTIDRIVIKHLGPKLGPKTVYRAAAKK